MKTLLALLFTTSAVLADLKIQWDSSPGAYKYRLYEIKGSTPILVAETTGLDGQVLNALIGTHTYKLSAVNETGEGPMTSAFNVPVTAVAGAPSVPLAPTNIKLTK